MVGALGGLTAVVDKLKVWGRKSPERPNFGLRIMASLEFIFYFLTPSRLADRLGLQFILELSIAFITSSV